MHARCRLELLHNKRKRGGCFEIPAELHICLGTFATAKNPQTDARRSTPRSADRCAAAEKAARWYRRRAALNQARRRSQLRIPSRSPPGGRFGGFPLYCPAAALPASTGRHLPSTCAHATAGTRGKTERKMLVCKAIKRTIGWRNNVKNYSKYNDESVYFFASAFCLRRLLCTALARRSAASCENGACGAFSTAQQAACIQQKQNVPNAPSAAVSCDKTLCM